MKPELEQDMSVDRLSLLIQECLDIMCSNPVSVTPKGVATKTLCIKLTPADYPRIIGQKGVSIKHWQKLAGWMGDRIGETVEILVESVPRGNTRHGNYAPDMSWGYDNIQDPLEEIITWMFGPVGFTIDEGSESFIIDAGIPSREVPSHINLEEVQETIEHLFRSICNANGRKLKLTLYKAMT